MERNYYFDNVKFFLMLLIVIGHCLEQIIYSNTSSRVVYIAVYSFHVPLFAFISGYFSSSTMAYSNFKKHAINLLVPYLIFQTFFSLLIIIGTKFKDVHFEFFYPHNVYWYLLSLFFWRIILPFVARIRFPIVVSVFLLAALACGYCESINRFLSLSRTIAFFPFFLIGFYLKSQNIATMVKKIPKPVAIATLLCACSIAFVLKDTHIHWLYSDTPYRSLLGGAFAYGFFYRLLVIVAAFIVGASFMSIVTERQYFFTRFGGRVIYIFLLHYIPIRLMDYCGFFSKLQGEILPVFFLIALGTVLTFLLAYGGIAAITQPIVEPLRFFAGPFMLRFAKKRMQLDGNKAELLK